MVMIGTISCWGISLILAIVGFRIVLSSFFVDFQLSHVRCIIALTDRVASELSVTNKDAAAAKKSVTDKHSVANKHAASKHYTVTDEYTVANGITVSHKYSVRKEDRTSAKRRTIARYY